MARISLKCVDTHPKVTLKKLNNPPEPCPRQIEEAIRSLKDMEDSFILPSLQRAGAPFAELRHAITVSLRRFDSQLRDLEKYGGFARKLYPEVPPKLDTS